LNGKQLSSVIIWLLFFSCPKWISSFVCQASGSFPEVTNNHTRNSLTIEGFFSQKRILKSTEKFNIISLCMWKVSQQTKLIFEWMCQKLAENCLLVNFFYLFMCQSHGALGGVENEKTISHFIVGKPELLIRGAGEALSIGPYLVAKWSTGATRSLSNSQLHNQIRKSLALSIASGLNKFSASNFVRFVVWIWSLIASTFLCNTRPWNSKLWWWWLFI